LNNNSRQITSVSLGGGATVVLNTLPWADDPATWDEATQGE